MSEHSSTVELLNCPFCGRVPVLKRVPFSREVLDQAPDPDSYWWIGCEIDVNITGCGIGHSNIEKAEAICKWNTRAFPTEADKKLLTGILEWLRTERPNKFTEPLQELITRLSR